MRSRISAGHFPRQFTGVTLGAGLGMVLGPQKRRKGETRDGGNRAGLIGCSFGSGLAQVKATGRTRSGWAVGRPRRDVDLQAVADLRAAGPNWREIAVALKVPPRTLHRAWQNLPPASAA